MKFEAEWSYKNFKGFYNLWSPVQPNIEEGNSMAQGQTCQDMAVYLSAVYIVHFGAKGLLRVQCLENWHNVWPKILLSKTS